VNVTKTRFVFLGGLRSQKKTNKCFRLMSLPTREGGFAVDFFPHLLFKQWMRKRAFLTGWKKNENKVRTQFFFDKY